MDADRLKSLQAPLKDRYRSEPSSARITLRAAGQATEGIACKIETGKGLVEAGLHPATGGTGALACSGDMLLEALVALRILEPRDVPGVARSPVAAKRTVAA